MSAAPQIRTESLENLKELYLPAMRLLLREVGYVKQADVQGRSRDVRTGRDHPRSAPDLPLVNRYSGVPENQITFLPFQVRRENLTKANRAYPYSYFPTTN